VSKKKGYRQYENFQLGATAKMVKNKNMLSIKQHKRTLCHGTEGDKICFSKLGGPFALTSDLEIEIYHYIISMQVCIINSSPSSKNCLQLATVAGRSNLFNEDGETASS